MTTTWTKMPAALAGSTVHLARGTASAGLKAGAQLASWGTTKVAALASSATKSPVEDASQPTPAEEPQQTPHDESSTTPPAPVNVVEELGLDPAPAARPKPAKKATAATPITKIDAAADAGDVSATPADVAKIIGTDQD